MPRADLGCGIPVARVRAALQRPSLSCGGVGLYATGTAGVFSSLGLPPEREGGLRIPERPADREDREPDPREEEGDPDHDPEQADLR